MKWITEGCGYVADERDDDDGLKEAARLWVQSHKEVHDAREQHGDHEEYWDLGDCFTQKVNICPVHAVVVFPHKHWHFRAKHLHQMECKLYWIL